MRMTMTMLAHDYLSVITDQINFRFFFVIVIDNIMILFFFYYLLK